MFGMSLTEIVLILLIALVVMGPEKIPEAARFMGKMMREIRKASNLLRDAVALDDDHPARPMSMPMAAGATAAGQVAMRDPDPTLDVRMVDMRPVRQASPEAVELALANPPQTLRETYLHVPYDETI